MQIECLRGRLVDIKAMEQYFEHFRPGQFQVVILDSLYRMLPAGIDENDNAAMSQVYNAIDRYADMLQASFVLVHHSSKGSQASKSITDVGSGAGAISRAADAHLILRPHEEPNCAVFESAVRSWPPVEPRVFRWSFPIWVPEDSLDPARLKMEPSRHRPKADAAKPEIEEPEIRWTAKKFVDTFVTAIPQEFLDILDAATDAGLPERKVETLVRKAVREKLIYRQQAAKNRPAEYATVPFPEPENKVDVVRRLLAKDPQLSNREAAERLSVSHTLVNRVRRELESLNAGNSRVATA